MVNIDGAKPFGPLQQKNLYSASWWHIMLSCVFTAGHGSFCTKWHRGLVAIRDKDEETKKHLESTSWIKPERSTLSGRNSWRSMWRGTEKNMTCPRSKFALSQTTSRPQRGLLALRMHVLSLDCGYLDRDRGDTVRLFQTYDEYVEDKLGISAVSKPVWKWRLV